MAGALEWRDANSCSPCSHAGPDTESNLRKSLVKSRLVECQEKLPRSDSLDSMLGDSLLDPPQSLQKIPPKRYQSPSRCGSPSLEAPDHLLFGNNGGKNESYKRVNRRYGNPIILRKMETTANDEMLQK